MNKKIISFFIFFIFISGIFLVGSSLNEKNKVSDGVYEELENKEKVSVIIKIKSDSDNSLFKITSFEDKKEIIKKSIKNKNFGEVNDLISAEILEDELKKLEQNENIEKIFISHRIKAFLQDSVPLINASITWAVNTAGTNITGTGETICVIDTGIDFTHPSLVGKNKTCVIDCFNKLGDCIENCSIGDDSGHGTHVAGIVAASGSINGVAIGADLIGVKVLDLNGNGSGIAETDLVKAIDWCVLNRNLYNISVITMSLGTSILFSDYCDSTFTNTWTKSINNATLMNISVMTATGNSGSGVLRNTTAIAAPACITNATSVSATDKDDSISSYGHYNSLTDFFAPGTSINSTVPIGSCEFCAPSRYNPLSGTSMATPHVAGVFALFRQFFVLQNSRVPTPQEIQSNLNSSGKKISTGEYNISRIDIYSVIDTITKSVSVTFISPADNVSTKQNETNFTCNSTSKNYQLTNISFYLWNSTNNLIYNLTKNITGNSNLSVFNYTFSIEDSYFWNCISYNNQSYSNSNLNYTITYDITTPNISSVSSGSISTTGAIITWTTNENANSSVNYGTTAGLGSITSNSSLATSHSVSLSSLSSSTLYYYNVTSCDAVNNCNITGANSFTTSTPTPVVSSSSGGGGGSSVTTATYVTTPEQVSAGYTQTLSKSDKIKFSFFDTKSEEHVLTIVQVGAGFVEILVQSNPIKLSLGIGQSAKLNFTSAVYYDLYVKLDSIKDNKAELTIQTIHEEIPKPVLITGNIIEDITEQENEIPEKKIEDLEFKISKLQKILYLVVAIFIIVIIFLLFRERKNIKENLKLKKRQEDIKEHKKKFKQIKPKKQIK